MPNPNFPSGDERNFFSRIADAVAHRYDLNAEKSLRDVYQLNADFLDTRSDAEFALANRENILAILANPRTFEQLVDLFVRRSIEFTYLSNQFIQLDYSEAARFRRIYTGYLHQLSRILSESSSEPNISAQR